jgi:putative nucleotidyltransferase with HDIG domain
MSKAKLDPAERKARVRARIEASGNLPTLPGVVARIIETVEDEHTTARRLGAEIARDQVVSAKVLKLVNSGFYGFSQPIATIPHAVAMLGFDTVKSLVLSSSVVELMDNALPGLWDHSLACARASTLLAEEADLEAPEEIGVVGLLHDLGKVILCQALPDEFARIRQRVERGGMLFVRSEQDVLGTHHGEIGAWLLEKWALPPALTVPIAEHHDPRPTADHAVRTAAVHVADILVRAEGFGHGGDRRMPGLAAGALQTLGLDLDAVERVMDRLHTSLPDLQRG